MSELSDTDKLIMYEAISDYSLDLKEPELIGFPKALFSLIRPILDANIQRWRNGNKGGAPKGNINNKGKKKLTESQPKVNQDTTESQANKDKDKDKDKNTLSKESVRDFDSLSIKHQLLSDETWKESVCMQSMLGLSFMAMIPEQVDKFVSYIISIGEEHSISSLSDAKRRFTYWWQNHGRKEVQSDKKQEYIIPD